MSWSHCLYPLRHQRSAPSGWGCASCQRLYGAVATVGLIYAARRAAAVVSAVGGRSGSAEAPAADAEEGSISPTFGLGLSGYNRASTTQCAEADGDVFRAITFCLFL